jgi:tRNA threonylcarbamoyladenosine biosynthesis protein TsaB
LVKPQIILAFDTSAAYCAAALFCEDWIVAHQTVPMAKGQAEYLMPMLETMLISNGMGWRDLTALAVGVGPGNFTGIRISVSAARGLALGLGIPAIGVSNFEAMMWQRGSASCIVSLEAPRGMAFVQHLKLERPNGPARLIDPADAPRDLQTSNMQVIGYRAEEIGRQFEASWENMTLPPIAETIAWVADLRLIRGEQFARPAPFYVREADATPPSDPPPVILP